MGPGRCGPAGEGQGVETTGMRTRNKAGFLSRRSCLAGLAACLCLCLAARVLADVLTAAQVAQFSYNAGFRGDGLVNAIAIAYAESSFRTDAVNVNTDGSRDRGLWQINTVHKNVTDTCAFTPACAADAAYVISNSGTNWHPWSTLNGDRYNGYLPAARAAAADVSGTAIDLYVDGNAGSGAVQNDEPSTPYGTLAAAVTSADTSHAFTLHLKPFWYKEKIGTSKHLHFVPNGPGTVRIGG